MNIRYSGLENRLTRIEREIEREIGDPFKQALKDSHYDVKIGMRLVLMVKAAEHPSAAPVGEVELTKEQRGGMADDLLETNVRYQLEGRDAFVAGLPKSYVCGDCGTVVAFDVEQMMRVESSLTACECHRRDNQRERI